MPRHSPFKAKTGLGDGVCLTWGRWMLLGGSIQPVSSAPEPVMPVDEVQLWGKYLELQLGTAWALVANGHAGHLAMHVGLG